MTGSRERENHFMCTLGIADDENEEKHKQVNAINKMIFFTHSKLFMVLFTWEGHLIFVRAHFAGPQCV
jgi:hypothetical protein